jgi:hypothetical protein
MKINEIITEDRDAVYDVDENNGEPQSHELPSSHEAATPAMSTYPGLSNSDPYAQWRFAGIYMAGSPNFEHDPVDEGPVGQKFITVAYSDGEHAIIDAAEKKYGVKSHRLTPNGSKEDKDIYNTSPIQARGPIKLKRK